MPSRLSSLLVRDGLVGVKRMEKAFQRQVIYGGSLDTILLEMSLVPEERLIQYLALASGLPPAARDEGSSFDELAIALIPQEIAQEYRAVPLSLEGEAVRVLVCAPLEMSELEDLADKIDRPLQPLIAPEYRWHLVFAGAFGLDPPARFTTLARAIDTDPTATPVGRSRSVIVDAAVPVEPPGVETVAVESDRTVKTPLPFEAVSPLDGISESFVSPTPTPERPVTVVEMPRVHRPTLIGIKPVTAQTQAPAVSRTSTPIAVARTATPVSIARTPTPPPLTDTGHLTPATPTPPPTKLPASTATPAPVLGSLAASATTSPRFSGPKKPIPRPSTEPIHTEGRDGPLGIVPARELLSTADDRDTVFITLLRAARARARYAGLLTVQGGAAIGRVALAEPNIDTQTIQSVLIPLDVISPFRTVVNNQQPHIGSLVSGDPGIDSMVIRLGGTMPPSALVMPLVLRGRVVALVVAHRGHSDLKLLDVTELLPLATAASDAIGRLIVKHKQSVRAVPESPVADLEADYIDTRRIVSQPDPQWAPESIFEPATMPSLPQVPGYEEGTEMTITAETAAPIDDVLDEIENARESEAEAAIADAVARASETLGALAKRFPGQLRIDRFSVTGRPLRAAQYGGLLELVIRLGSVAAELLIDKMSAPQRDVRFYATVCAAELRPRSAVYALVERLFDNDYGVRRSAVEALAGYPIGELAHAMLRARRAVHANDPEVVQAATDAIIELGDIEAIPDLMGVIERGDRSGEHARKALVALTAQDFGPSEKRWRKWWETAYRRHRIEWLIEGLLHKEDSIREGAISGLRRLTGEYFGYHHDLARREREIAAERWANWWRDSGRHRFVLREDERHRPTALVPIRRD